jgi:hypothetical protein
LAESSFLRSLHHVATNIKAHLKAAPRHDSLTRTYAEKSVPDNLYTLVKWIITENSDCNTDFDESDIPYGIEHVHTKMYACLCDICV